MISLILVDFVDFFVAVVDVFRTFLLTYPFEQFCATNLTSHSHIKQKMEILKLKNGTLKTDEHEINNDYIIEDLKMRNLILLDSFKFEFLEKF